ncbi:Small ubiquitin-related modifier 1-like protein [Leptotrombidium deliense]|uniref:Small ubiquitin-related modifier 1-like protein n=1 Tax=Leptotrombidium deliense TaxID=299467 RepID=A0A443SHC7_9ACAR|nr:Small ubiquitin-related modifier 1-like protein [Leptotrombidium deliense]
MQFDLWANVEFRVTKEKREQKDFVKLRVIDQNNNEVNYRMRKSLQMKKLMDAYSERVGIDRNSLKFYVEHKKIENYDTPATLLLDDDDVIDVLFAIYISG